VAAELPELAGETLAEVEFQAFEEAVVAVAGAPQEIVERLAAVLDRELERPYTAQAVRRGPSEWMVGGRRTHASLISLALPANDAVEVIVAPDGERTAVLDGEPVAGLVEPAVDLALRELERRGRLRFQAFVARADRVDDDRWQVTVDPL
jgi:hypothetical protein